MSEMRKNLITLVVAFVALISATGLAAAQPANISILYTNDTHGHLQSFFSDGTKPFGGVAKRAIFLQEKRRHRGMVWLTLDAGDTISGTPLSDVFQGFLDVEALNRLGYDAMTLGVHDFDYGIDVLRQRVSEAKFPVLSANIVLATDGTHFVKPYTIIERGGVKIAILGLTSPEVANQTAPGNFRNLKVLDPVEVARELVPQLRQQADLIIGLTHLGVNEDIRLASQVPGMDAIVGGLSHSELAVPMKVGDTLIVQAAYYGRSVGLLKMSFRPNADNRMQRVYFDNTLETLDGRYAENNDYLAWLSEYKQVMAERMGTLLGSTAHRLNASKVKSAETEMGNFVTDTLREVTNSDVAVLPAAFFRDGLPDGPVTLGDLFAAIPYDHYAVVLTVSGAQLARILNDAANQIGKPGFPQVSGVSFAIYNGTAPQSTIRVAGVDLDPDATYRVATSDFLADGGLGYAAMGTISDVEYTGRMVRDLVRDKLAGGTTITARLSQRIMFLAQEPQIMASATTPETEPLDEPAPATDEPDTPMGEPDFIEDEPVLSETRQPTLPAFEGEFPEDEPIIDTEPLADEPVLDEPLLDEPAVDESVQDEPAADAPDDEPVWLDDEVVRDGASDATDTAETPAEPAVSQGSLPDTAPAAEATTVGSATRSEGGLNYEFTVTRTPRGRYEYTLLVTNSAGAPLSMEYASGRRFDFALYRGSDLLWNYNHNRFFAQGVKVDPLDGGAERRFGAEWDGIAIDRSSVPRGQSYRFEATHHLSDNPVLISFEAVLP